MENVSFDFTGKNILVTGATSGIGLEIAINVARGGAKVFAVGRRQDELNKHAEKYSNVIPIECDITDYLAVNDKIRYIVNQHGKLDGFVGCAGISELIPLRVLDLERAKMIMEVNFWGNINLLGLLAKRNITNNNASFVLISSVAAHCGVKGEFIYSASKAALLISAKSLAKEISGRGQRINTVSPGWVQDTEITDKAKDNFTDVVYKNLISTYPLGLGEKRDVSAVCLFLLSDAAKWITGADFIVDGGHLA